MSKAPKESKVLKTKIEIDNDAARERIKKIKRWQSRENNLRVRKENRLTAKDFCQKYGIDANYYTRAKRLDRFLPKDDFVNAVEAGFEAERV